VREQGQLFATPLFFGFAGVEVTDVTFAVDSIPAVFGITRDPLSYTSTYLRSDCDVYFLLAGVLTGLAYIKYGLAAVLAFVYREYWPSDWVLFP